MQMQRIILTKWQQTNKITNPNICHPVKHFVLNEQQTNKIADPNIRHPVKLSYLSTTSQKFPPHKTFK